MNAPDDKFRFQNDKGELIEIAKSEIAAACKIGDFNGEEIWQVAPIEELMNFEEFYKVGNPDVSAFITFLATRADFESIGGDFIAVPIYGEMHFDSEESEEDDEINQSAFVRLLEIEEIYRPDDKNYKHTTIRMRETLVDFDTPLSPQELIDLVPQPYKYHVIEALARGDATKKEHEDQLKYLGPGNTH